jgi:hypothetical protein
MSPLVFAVHSPWVACVALAGELRAELEGSPLPETWHFGLSSRQGAIVGLGAPSRQVF